MMKQNTAITEMAMLREATTRIVCAYAANAKLTTSELVDTIGSAARALRNAHQGIVETTTSKLLPAIPIKKSITYQFIVCLEDGRKLQILKRHLRSSHGLTPAQYRAKWNLPTDYPMVAAARASHMSALAKASGLGTGGRQRKRKAKGLPAT